MVWWLGLLSGEFGGEQHRRLVFAVRSLFESGLQFRVYETSYDGPQTAMVSHGSDKVRFDLLMKQEAEGGGVHYFCECKFRGAASSGSELKLKLKDFVESCLKLLDYVRTRYGNGHFCFLFIANIPFIIWEEHLRDVEFLKGFLDDEEVETNDLVTLSRHLRVVIVPTWLIDILTRQYEV